jgi:hypothetical protein
MEQGTGHTQVTDYSFLNSSFNIITNLRLPDPVDVFQPIQLNTLPDTLGWFGDQNSWIIGSFDCYDGLIDSSSWFPSKNVGEQWQYFVSEGEVSDTSECDGSIGIDIRIPVPTGFILYHPYPNPFNPTTTIQFSVSTMTIASLGIYDISGKLVETLVHGDFEAGEHEVIWNAVNHSSGIYFVELTSGKNRLVQKLVLLK